MPNDVLSAAIEVRVKLAATPSGAVPMPTPVILSSPIAFCYRRADGSDVVVEFCPEGPLVEFRADDQPYRFNLGATVDAFKQVLSIDPPSHIGDSEGAAP